MEGNDMAINSCANMLNMAQQSSNMNLDNEAMRQKSNTSKDNWEHSNTKLRNCNHYKIWKDGRKPEKTLLLLSHSNINLVDMFTSTLHSICHW